MADGPDVHQTSPIGLVALSAASPMSGGSFDLLKYKLVVFDLDGTLYRQAPVRRAMLFELLRQGGVPGRYARIKILHHFRKIREALADEGPADFHEPLFSRLANKTGYPKPFLIELVEEWMEQRPLVHLKAAIVPGARDVIKMLRHNDITVAVWSDYPVEAKLKSLDINVDHTLAATDADVNSLKPDPTGLHLAMKRTGVAPKATLMVGDRLSRDGAAATAAGVDFLLRNDKAPHKLTERQFYVRDYRALSSLNVQSADGALAVQNC